MQFNNTNLEICADYANCIIIYTNIMYLQNSSEDEDKNRLYRNRINYSDQSLESQNEQSGAGSQKQDPVYQSLYKFRSKNNADNYVDPRKGRKMSDLPKIQQSWEVYSYDNDKACVIKETVFCRTMAWVIFRQDKDRVNAWCRVCGARKRARKGNTTNLLHHINQVHYMLKQMLAMKMTQKQTYPHNIVNLCEDATIKLKDNAVQIQDRRQSSAQNPTSEFRVVPVIQRGRHVPRRRGRMARQEQQKVKKRVKTNSNPSRYQHNEANIQNFNSYTALRSSQMQQSFQPQQALKGKNRSKRVVNERQKYPLRYSPEKHPSRLRENDYQSEFFHNPHEKSYHYQQQPQVPRIQKNYRNYTQRNQHKNLGSFKENKHDKYGKYQQIEENYGLPYDHYEQQMVPDYQNQYNHDTLEQQYLQNVYKTNKEEEEESSSFDNKQYQTSRKQVFNLEPKIQENCLKRQTFLTHPINVQIPQEKDSRMLEQLSKSPEIQIIKFQQNKQLAGLTFITSGMKNNMSKYSDSLSFWSYDHPVKLNQIKSVLYICGQDSRISPVLFGLVIIFKEVEENYLAIFKCFYERLYQIRKKQLQKVIICGPSFMVKYFQKFVNNKNTANKCVNKTQEDITQTTQIGFISLNNKVFTSKSLSAKQFILAKTIVIEVLNRPNKCHNFIGFFMTPNFVEKLSLLTPLNFGTQVSLTDFLTKIFLEEKQLVNYPSSSYHEIFNKVEIHKIRKANQLTQCEKLVSKEIFIKLCYSYIYSQYSLHIISSAFCEQKNQKQMQVRQINNNAPFNYAKVSYNVKFDEISEKWICQCCLFKYTELPCPHLIKVLIYLQKDITGYIGQKWIFRPQNSSTGEFDGNKLLQILPNNSLKSQTGSNNKIKIGQNNQQKQMKIKLETSFDKQQCRQFQQAKEAEVEIQSTEKNVDFSEFQSQYLGAISEDKFMQLFWT